MKTIPVLLSELEKGETTAVALIEQALGAIEANVDFNAVLNPIKDRALERAKKIDVARKSGEKTGRLAGIPFIVKDNMLAFGAPTTAASKMLQNFDAPFQAEVIERLENEGAICVGKANLDAFAHGGSTENSAFGPTVNPHDKGRVAGGSSGGSAASVALGITPFALGSDTGGSVRQPASFCGVVGYKPTYGAVSRYGVVAMASSTDVVGPLANTVDDARLITEIIGGRDEKDGTTLADYLENEYLPQKKYKLALVKEWNGSTIDPGVREVISTTVERLQSAGHVVDEVSMPTFDYALAVYYVVVPAEIASNLARYDGIRYGLRLEAGSLKELYTSSREAGFVDENKRRIIIGNYVLSSGYYDAYYKKAQQARTLIIKNFSEVFESYDAIIGPVSSTPAFAFGEYIDDPLEMYLTDTMTVTASLAGLPAISVPAGKAGGMPVGLQIIGKAKADQTVFALAQIVERLKAA